MTPKIGPAASKLVNAAVAQLFARIRAQVLGRKRTDKDIAFRYNPDWTLTGIFDAAARSEGARPDQTTLRGLLDVAESYLDAAEARTKAHIGQTIQSFLQDAATKHIETGLVTVLEGRLATVFGEVARDVRRIVESESSIVRNMSIIDGIIKGNALAGVEDPTICFISVNDIHRCDECRDLHTLADGVTPRLWKLSQIETGYHKKGSQFPSMSGLHPHCRCQPTTIMPGYGFDSNGRVEYKSPGFDAYVDQRRTAQ